MTPDTQLRSYLRALEEGDLSVLEDFFHPAVTQEEFPNQLTPHGARRDLAALLESARRGKEVVAEQRYEILNSIGDGERTALEVSWRARLKVPLGDLPVGAEVRARFAVFIERRDGKIIAQRNYDCFEPFTR